MFRLHEIRPIFQVCEEILYWSKLFNESTTGVGLILVPLVKSSASDVFCHDCVNTGAQPCLDALEDIS